MSQDFRITRGNYLLTKAYIILTCFRRFVRRGRSFRAPGQLPGSRAGKFGGRPSDRPEVAGIGGIPRGMRSPSAGKLGSGPRAVYERTQDPTGHGSSGSRASGKSYGKSGRIRPVLRRQRGRRTKPPLGVLTGGQEVSQRRKTNPLRRLALR